MAQTSLLQLANAAGASFRAALNTALAALFSTNSGASFPAVTAPGMLHVNTTGGGQVLWMRNAADNAWVQVSFGVADILSLGGLSLGRPAQKTANFAVAVGENHLINAKVGSACVVTLPAPGGVNEGRMLRFVNRQAQAVVSAAANVVPQTGGAATTAILPAIIGAQADLVSDGTNWLMLESGSILSAFGMSLGAAADAPAAYTVLGGRPGAPDAVLEDQRASGTSGTGSTAGVWVTRALNTETRDPNNIVTLASNQFTVTVDCWCEFAMPGVGMNNHQARIFNVTDSVVVALGTVEWSPNSGANQTRTFGGGALVAGKTYRIEHRGAVTNANAFGVAASFGNAEVYGRVQLWRL